MSDVTHAFIESPQYERGAMFINYDEWGGFFDHVPPPFVPDDRENRATRQELGPDRLPDPRRRDLALSRAAGGVSHMPVTHESILKLISYRFRLGYLNKRHRYASNIGRTFDWRKPDIDPPALPDPAAIVATPCAVQASQRASGRSRTTWSSSRPPATSTGSATRSRMRASSRCSATRTRSSGASRPATPRAPAAS